VRGGVVSSGLLRAPQGSSGLLRAAHRESLELGESFVTRHEFGRREEEHLMTEAIRGHHQSNRSVTFAVARKST